MNKVIEVNLVTSDMSHVTSTDEKEKANFLDAGFSN